MASDDLRHERLRMLQYLVRANEIAAALACDDATGVDDDLPPAETVSVYERVQRFRQMLDRTVADLGIPEG
jgi:hypothetical protein